jgi:predicted nucleic acid-binding protein
VLAVLDSTVLIDFLRGRPAVDRVGRLRQTGDTPATTAINIEEIVRGMRKQEASAVDALVDGLVILAVDTMLRGWPGDGVVRTLTAASPYGRPIA